MPYDDIDILKYLPTPEQQAEDEDYKRRVMIGSDLLSLLNLPSAAEISSGARIQKPDYRAQGEAVIKSMPDRFGQAAKLADVVKTYQEAKKNAALNARAASKVSPEDVARYKGYKIDVNPESTYAMVEKEHPPLKDLELAATKSDINASNRADVGTDLIQQRRDLMNHAQVVSKLKSDTLLNQRLTQYNNLSNALAIVADAKTLTPQQIAEFQQAVRSNIGVKGTGGVDERADTQIKTLGLNSANLRQFITGDPVELAKDSKLVHHLQDLARVEQNNISKQKNARISALSAGFKSMYQRRPDLWADVQDLSDQIGGQFESAPTEPGGRGVAIGKKPASNADFDNMTNEQLKQYLGE